MTDPLIELVEFLEARYVERAAWALAASEPPDYYGPGGPADRAKGVHWRWGTGGNWEPIEPDPVLDEYLGDAGDAVTLVTVETWQPVSTGRPLGAVAFRTDEVRSGVAGHIVLNDPAAVLADVEARRGILELARVAATRFNGGMRYVSLTLVLRYLALPYAGHPDYRREWAPRG